MKTCLTPLLALLSLSAVGHAQVIVLTGHVTNATGIYESAYNTNSSVTLTLDFTSKPQDIFNGANPHEGRYFVPGYFDVAGDNVILFPGVFRYGVGLHDSLLDQPGGEGLFIGQGWNGATPGTFMQYFLSQHDILSSVTLFPANIPFTEFSRVDGYYANDTFGASGRIDWSITGYEGFAEGVQPSDPLPPMSPVPEPATYGIIAALSLLGVALWRRGNAVRWTKTSAI